MKLYQYRVIPLKQATGEPDMLPIADGEEAVAHTTAALQSGEFAGLFSSSECVHFVWVRREAKETPDAD